VLAARTDGGDTVKRDTEVSGHSLFIIDDHELIRRALTEVFVDAGFRVVGEADTVERARGRLDAADPDVVLADVHLPDGSGVDLCAESTARVPRRVWVILTSDGSDAIARAAAAAGADGLVLKQVPPSELVGRVERAVCGREPVAAVDATRSRAPVSSGIDVGDLALATLTSQESKVLALLELGRSNRQIACELLLSERTVRNYISSMFAKLGVCNRTEAAMLSVRSRTDTLEPVWSAPLHVNPVRF
jgi:two-component system, NarL family, response regulator DevR